MKPLKPGQHVDVVVTGRDPVGAVVEATLPDGSLLLAAHDDAPVAAPTGAALHFTTERGILSVDGLLRAGAERSFPFAPRGEPRLLQRREHVRVEATIPVVYSPNGKRRFEGRTFDVSGGGFALARYEGLDVGATTHFALELGADEDGPLEVFGTAVRRTEGGALAVKIEVIAPGERERLIHWIFRRERRRRAYARGV